MHRRTTGGDKSVGVGEPRSFCHTPANAPSMSERSVRSRLAGAAPTSVLSGRRLDAGVAALSTLMVTGVALDFRAHASGISFAEEGFLTPEHTFFYSMFLAVAALIGAATYRERRRGANWVAAVPEGYGWGVVGVLVFGGAGAGDFLWHSAFGFEESFQALVSPSHLALAAGASLFLASPLRAAWYRDDDPRGAGLVPVVVSATLVLVIVSLFGSFLNPAIRPYPSYEGVSEGTTITFLVAYPLVLVGAATALVRRFRLPPGSFAVLFTVPVLVSTLLEGHPLLAVPALVTGALADALTWRCRPTPANHRSLRLFCTTLPATFAATYLAVVDLGYPGGIVHVQAGTYTTWSVHVLVGAVVLPAAAGLLLSYALAPGPEAGGGRA